MKISKQIFNLTNIIKNRIMYQSPKDCRKDIDYQKILEKGIDLSLPIFIVETPYNKDIVKALGIVQKELAFNLVIRENNKLFSKIKNLFIIKQSEIPSLDYLNVNYKCNTEYKKIEKGNFMIIGDKLTDFMEKEFFYEKKGIYQSACYSLKKYILNGENIQIEIINTDKNPVKINFEYNYELPKGYYFFEKINHGVKIVNLFNNEVNYFNAMFGKIDENYSCVDGVENCTYARVNFKSTILLNGYQKKSFFINIGKSRILLNKLSDMNKFFEISQEKNYEIFNIKVTSEDKNFERLFNNFLPIKIWKKWVENSRDYDLENKYLEIKNNICVKNGKYTVLGRYKEEIKDIFVFDGKSYKKLENARK